MKPFNSKEVFILSFIILFITSISLHSQEKLLTYQQTYKGGQPRLFNPLPQLKGWFDDNHYLQVKGNK